MATRRKLKSNQIIHFGRKIISHIVKVRERSGIDTKTIYSI